MSKKLFAILILIVQLLAGCLVGNNTDANTRNNTPSHKVEFLSNKRISVDRRLPDGANIYRTSFSKIEYLTSQAAGIGYGRPGTEEFLNADIIVKLKEDGNTYGFSLTFFDNNGPSKAMFDTLIAALVYDMSVEIVYYDKAGTKQMIKVTAKK